MATHSSILAWTIPWTEEPGGLQSMGLQRVGHDQACTHTPECINIYTGRLIVYIWFAALRGFRHLSGVLEPLPWIRRG